MILLKILGYPFSIIYGCITAIRNFLYDKGIKQSYTIPGKSIVIGNLSMGGTGKSPHTLYLWNLLQQKHNVAILSRGYGRKTKGLIEVKEVHSSSEVGDEPLMFKKRVNDTSTVVVSESRKNGVDFIRSNDENAVVLLDDAFQHRKVKAGFSVLLTDYNKPFYSDFVVPSGTLREWRCGKNRADCIIVTKCPDELSVAEKQSIVKKLNFPSAKDGMKENKRQIFFSKIIYGDLVSFGRAVENYSKILLVTGIANPKPLVAYLNRFCEVESLEFSDHHEFSAEDLSKIHAKFDTFTGENAIIATTEKDFVRLESLLSAEQKKNYPWYFQTITIEIENQEEFNTLINSYVDTI